MIELQTIYYTAGIFYSSRDVMITIFCWRMLLHFWLSMSVQTNGTNRPSSSLVDAAQDHNNIGVRSNVCLPCMPPLYASIVCLPCMPPLYASIVCLPQTLYASLGNFVLGYKSTAYSIGRARLGTAVVDPAKAPSSYTPSWVAMPVKCLHIPTAWSREAGAVQEGISAGKL